MEESNLLGWVARYDHERGDYRSANGLVERQYDVRRRLLGEEHPDILASLSKPRRHPVLRAQRDLAAEQELEQSS